MKSEVFDDEINCNIAVSQTQCESGMRHDRYARLRETYKISIQTFLLSRKCLFMFHEKLKGKDLYFIVG